MFFCKSFDKYIYIAALTLLQGCTFLSHNGPANNIIKEKAYNVITVKDTNQSQKIQNSQKKSNNNSVTSNYNRLSRNVSVTKDNDNKVNDSGTDLKYSIIEINQGLLKKIDQYQASQTYKWPLYDTKTKNDNITLSVGDVLSVSIYESSSGGVFTPTDSVIRTGNFVTIPNQIVDVKGFITIPYAGQIMVNGKNPIEISKIIEEKLQLIAIEPQVIVNVVSRGSQEISVLGAVNNSTRYSLNFNGERVLDAISRAGGVAGNGFDLDVWLQRGNSQYKLRFNDVIQNYKYNIFLKPNDTVYLEENPYFFTLMGASNLLGRFNFNRQNLMLSEALGYGGGADDNRADPSEVYVFRNEDCNLINEINQGVDEKIIGCSEHTETSPMLYNLDIRNPTGFLLAQNFKISNNDVVFIGNSRSSELIKLLNIISLNSTTTNNVKSVDGAN